MMKYPMRAALRAARRVLESPVFWAAALQALGAVAVALIGRL